jgi:hypothetical protein
MLALSHAIPSIYMPIKSRLIPLAHKPYSTGSQLMVCISHHWFIPISPTNQWTLSPSNQLVYPRDLIVQ